MAAYVNAIESSIFVTLYFGVILFVTPLWAPQLLLVQICGNVNTRHGFAFCGTDLLALLPFLVAANAWHIPVYAGLRPMSAFFAVVGVNVFVVAIWVSALHFMKRRGIIRGRLLFQLWIYPLVVVGSAGVIVNLLILGGVALRAERHGNVVADGLAAGSLLFLCVAVCLFSRYLFHRSFYATRKREDQDPQPKR